MLDERKAAILRAVVEEYIETAQPVGSGHVASSPRVRVSSATVRSDMAVLEQEGYLLQPHTSAGRIPTEKGYRFFVDALGGPGRLPAPQTHQVRTFFARAHGELETMLHDTSRLLSDLTDYAAVVTGPPVESATVRSVQLVGLAPRVVLLLAVLSTGAVEKHTVEIADDVGDERLAAASAHLTAHLVGAPLADARRPIASSGDADTDAIVDIARNALAARGRDQAHGVFVGGTARMASAFDAVETVRQVLGILEQQYVVVSLLRDLLDRGLQVAIGTETGLVPLAECSLVVAPYAFEGERAGTIAVLGPTRMNYPQALAAVAVVSTWLGSTLGDD
jgi:heat-inducible transcriptional repressor